MMDSRFEEDGYVRYPSAINAELMDDYKLAIKNLILTAYERLDFDQQKKFEQKCHDESQLFDQGMLALYELNSKLFQMVVDASSNNVCMHRLINSESVLTHAANLIGTKQLGDLILTQPRLRVDLPDEYASNKKKIHLGFHQESGYFKMNVSHSTGIVLWIPIFDCSQAEGALKVLQSSHKNGQVEHQTWYEDPVNFKHKRASVPTDITEQYTEETLEAQSGDIAFQKFHLIHRSGDNISNKVRYTIVARYSDGRAEDFKPVSWT
ncbi:phytanoyl-CoA dioxygenase family protein [Catenovulum adriaticum]|uniref:Phytanoyl-CoA dioxygenase family protein n=1 Tax=Catenovulum adriaticum TaxID=2984846 RepID=A0ABY7ANC5_9ALTE|nr:phytanoyl-CoA dioxygenase family protein [Catenovulum sp. TS8]WAJ71054.1 phytanoyl-CoA dioxygenase family protein [Catenovulum sp. TS8]